MRNSSSARDIFHDVIPGLNVAIIVLPQAIAFSFLAGVQPHFGIYCAIYGVLIAAVINPSRIYHGGPNSSVAVAIGVALLPYAPQFGQDYMGYVLSLSVMVGIIQLFFALFKPLSRLLDFMSEAVISGMIFGIGLFLIFKSIAPFAGLPLNTDSHWHLVITWQTFLSAAEFGNAFALEVGFVTLLGAVIFKNIKYCDKIYLLIGLFFGTLYSQFLNHNYGGLMATQIEQVGNIHLPLIIPSLPTFSPEALPDLLSLIPAAFAVALLGLFQTVAIVRQSSRSSGEYVNTKYSKLADAIANITAGFTSSIPGCGSFNRVALMQALKVRTRWAAVFSALFLFILIHFAKDILAIIPLSAMAAIIMLVGANMLRISQFKHHFSSRIETVVFFAAFVSVHIFGLLNAVLIGAGFAFINWVWRRSHPTVTCHDNEISIHGEMYYATIPVIEPFFYKMFAKYPRVSVNLVNVSYMDTEAARWLTKLVHVKDHEVQFILSSNQTLEKDLFNNASTDLGRLNIIEAA